MICFWRSAGTWLWSYLKRKRLFWGMDIIAIILNNRFGIPTTFMVGLFDCVVMLMQFDATHALSFVYGAVMIFTCSATMN